KALEIKADYPEAMNALSTLYNNQKRFDEAAAMSAKAAAAGPSGGAGNADAETKFEETLKIDANHPEAHYQLGMALLNEGKLQEAVAEFENYVKISPN